MKDPFETFANLVIYGGISLGILVFVTYMFSACFGS